MDDLLPIREISKLTGVNSVTLRAWERRYGLIKPLRTDKGHRLYRVEDVELIKNIKMWLARGLAISKVSELLVAGQFEKDLPIENIWESYRRELREIMAQLNRGKFDAFFNQLFAVYPVSLVADELIIPTLDSLGRTGFGNHLKQSVLANRLAEYVYMLSQRQRQQATSKRMGIVQLGTSNNPILNILLHYGLVVNQFNSEVIGVLPPAEVVFAAGQLSLDALIIYNDSCTSLGELKKDLDYLAQHLSLPILVVGHIASILDEQFPRHLVIATEAGQQAIFNLLETIFPVEK